MAATLSRSKLSSPEPTVWKKILHVHLTKLTFFQFSLKFVCAKSVKHLAEVRFLLILSVAKHENIIQIHQYEIIDVPMHKWNS